MGVVIQCPSCEGASRVSAEALGELVQCPHCSSPFLAAEASTFPLPALAEPVAPPVDQTPDDPESEPVPSDDSDAMPLMAAPTLPASVLFGLALLPFVIPLVWLAGTILTGWQPILSLALPIALSLAAATLSLAVVSTVDWTPATRIKGVLMIVGLAYLSGLTLYFLKTEAIEWAKKHFHESSDWHDFRPPRGQYTVRVPGDMKRLAKEPIPGWKFDGHQSAIEDDFAVPTFTVGFGTMAGNRRAAPEPTPEWFDRTRRDLETAANTTATLDRPRNYRGHVGREWTFALNDNLTTRVVWVFRVEERLYYLAVEGVNVAAEDDEVTAFFQSFRLLKDLN